MTFRAPIKVAKGLGSAHHGVAHWWAQRLTALALVPLMIWFTIGLAANAGADHAAAVAWIGSPVNAVLLVFTLIAGLYHGALGLQVVIEDYVGSEAGKLVLILLEKFAAIVLGAAAVFSVLKIAFGG